MTTLDLDDLEKKERQATEPAWSAHDCADSWLIAGIRGGDPRQVAVVDLKQDAAFIVALRNATPALIARARRADELEAENERLRAENAWMQEIGTEMAREITGRDDAMFHYDPPL